MTSIVQPVSRSVLAAAAGIAVFAFATRAHAEDPTKEQCISANEDAQTLRQKGHLEAARTQLLVCVRTSCPAAVRDDCAQRLDDIASAVPTIVFTAKGSGDVDLSDVKVTMDGVTIATRLDGSALTLEPGEHAFEFTAAGYPPVQKTLVLREGVKRRQEQIVFATGAAPGDAQAPAVVPIASPLPQAAVESGDGRRTLSYVLGGAGLVGLGLGTFFGLKAKSTYDDSGAHCPRGPSSCDAAGVSGGKDASTQAAVSTVAFLAGGALLATGVVVYLTAPKDGGVTLQPAVGMAGAGLRLGASW
jgi:hypothetical protein